MTRPEYLEFHKKFTERMIEITRQKNEDYCGDSNDPFSNFSRVSLLNICNVEQGFLVRMLDKLSRISSFAQRGVLSVKDESIEDTLMDLANYSILLAGYIKSKRAP